LFAIWQAIHTKSWFPPAKPGEVSESETNFCPFRKFREGGKESFFKSNQSKRTEDFGYVYPDIDGLDSSDAVWQRFQESYTWSIRTPKRPKFESPPSSMGPLDLNNAQVFQYPTSEESTGGAITSNSTKFSQIVASPVRAVQHTITENNNAQQP